MGNSKLGVKLTISYQPATVKLRVYWH